MNIDSVIFVPHDSCFLLGTNRDDQSQIQTLHYNIASATHIDVLSPSCICKPGSAPDVLNPNTGCESSMGNANTKHLKSGQRERGDWPSVCLSGVMCRQISKDSFRWWGTEKRDAPGFVLRESLWPPKKKPLSV